MFTGRSTVRLKAARQILTVHRMFKHAGKIVIGSSDSSEDDVRPSGRALKQRKRVIRPDTGSRLTRERAHDHLALFNKQSAESSNLSHMVLRSDDDPHESIIVNIIRKESQEPVLLHPKLATRFKQHQVEGVQFMWREITASKKEGGGQGCLLAHTMGLGKTAQAYVHLDICVARHAY